jgi:hypothetical protein
LVLLFLLVGLLSPAPQIARPAQTGCLSYGPDTVSITGVLERRTYPGRPGYASIPAGDEPETGFYVRLSKTLCTIADTTAPDAPALHGVRLVQLVLDSAGYTALRPRLGQRVVLRGTLFAALTGHHHSPLLLQWSPNGTTGSTVPTRRAP